MGGFVEGCSEPPTGGAGHGITALHPLFRYEIVILPRLSGRQRLINDKHKGKRNMQDFAAIDFETANNER